LRRFGSEHQSSRSLSSSAPDEQAEKDLVNRMAADGANADTLSASFEACTLTLSVEPVAQLARTESARVREEAQTSSLDGRADEEARVHERQRWEDDRELRAARAEIVRVRSAVSDEGAAEPSPLVWMEREVVLRICTFLRPKDLGRLACISRDFRDLLAPVLLLMQSKEWTDMESLPAERWVADQVARGCVRAFSAEQQARAEAAWPFPDEQGRSMTSVWLQRLQEIQAGGLAAWLSPTPPYDFSFSAEGEERRGPSGRASCVRAAHNSRLWNDRSVSLLVMTTVLPMHPMEVFGRAPMTT